MKQGLPWLRICCSQHFSQMKKVGAKLTLATVLARKEGLDGGSGIHYSLKI